MVTNKGAVALYLTIRDELHKKFPFKLKDKDIARIIDKSMYTMSMWKHGNIKIREVSVFYRLSQSTGFPMEYLYEIASEDVIPDHIHKKYRLRLMRIENK